MLTTTSPVHSLTRPEQSVFDEKEILHDFPVSLQIARILGGDALWAHNGEPVNFDELWMDDRANMLRLPGIVACSANRETLRILCDVAKDWSQNRYGD